MFGTADSLFIWAQIIGFIAMCCSVIGWQLKKPEHILTMNVPNSILWCTQYLMLGSLVAAAFSFLCIFKDIGVIKAKEKFLKYIIGIFLLVNAACIVAFYESIYSVLPFMVCLFINIPLLKKDNRYWMARGAFCAQICWIIFNLHVGAYMAVISAHLVMISTLIGMARVEQWDIKERCRNLLANLTRSAVINPRKYP